METPENGFSQVYETLYPVVFQVSFRITSNPVLAEDLCQEAFIKLFEREHPLPDLDQTKYWLIRVVRNISLNHEKRRTRERKAVERLKKITPKYGESGEAELIREETRTSVQQALSKIPYHLRMPIVLKEYGGLNYKEIGAILGISEGNVKIRVYRARERLAALLKEELKNVPGS